MLSSQLKCRPKLYLLVIKTLQKELVEAYLFAEAYLEFRQAHRKEFFAKIIYALKLLIAFAKKFVSDVWLSSKYAVEDFFLSPLRFLL